MENCGFILDGWKTLLKQHAILQKVKVKDHNSGLISGAEKFYRDDLLELSVKADEIIEKMKKLIEAIEISEGVRVLSVNEWLTAWELTVNEFFKFTGQKIIKRIADGRRFSKGMAKNEKWGLKGYCFFSEHPTPAIYEAGDTGISGPIFGLDVEYDNQQEVKK